ncbi:hypothetical protein Trydic_g2609 [Trypoxylus dichotomus]
MTREKLKTHLKFNVGEHELHLTLKPDQVATARKKLVERQQESGDRTYVSAEKKSTRENEDLTGVKGFDKQLPSTTKNARRGDETDSNNRNYRNPNDVSCQSLVQISRNTTDPAIGSTHEHKVLSPTIGLSSSSSDEVALYNNDVATGTNSMANLSFKETSKFPQNGSKLVTSVSGNLIGKNIDQACGLSSTLGIVSNRNRLSTSIKSQLSSTSRPSVKKKVSLTYPLSKHDSNSYPENLPYDSISGAVLSIGTTNLSVSTTPTEKSDAPDPSKNMDSASKVKVVSLYETDAIKDADDGLSKLGMVSEDCAMRIPIVDSRTDRAAPTTTVIHDDKSQNTACECWKICTCKIKDAHLHQATHGQGQAITCIIANDGYVPKRYTASYSFSYENIPSSDYSNPKT